MKGPGAQSSGTAPHRAVACRILIRRGKCLCSRPILGEVSVSREHRENCGSVKVRGPCSYDLASVATVRHVAPRKSGEDEYALG